jgi:hypothetical protein
MELLVTWPGRRTADSSTARRDRWVSVNSLTVGHRYIAEYVKHNKVLFRLIIELEAEGWSAFIFDRRNISDQNKEPIRAYYENVPGPEQGMHSLEIRLAWLLGRDILPIRPLVWVETPG